MKVAQLGDTSFLLPLTQRKIMITGTPLRHKVATRSPSGWKPLTVNDEAEREKESGFLVAMEPPVQALSLQPSYLHEIKIRSCFDYVTVG